MNCLIDVSDRLLGELSSVQEMPSMEGVQLNIGLDWGDGRILSTDDQTKEPQPPQQLVTAGSCAPGTPSMQTPMMHPM